MSSEVAKKRGRPKKVIADPIVAERPDTASKTTTRSKTTISKAQAASATPKHTIPAPPKPKASAKPFQKSSTASKPQPKPSAPPSKPAQSTGSPSKPAQAPPPSKISTQVHELSAKNGNPGFSTKSSYPTTAPSASPPKAAAPTASNSASSPPLKPASKPGIPFAEMNSEIVSKLTGRAGARPSAGGKPLPPGFKPLARQITATIIAIPIMLVTSYVLYQRLVLGEYKSLPGIPGMRQKEEAAVEKPTSENSRSV